MTPITHAWMVAVQIAKAYIFFYPLTMSCIWMLGALVFYLRYERHPHRRVSEPPLLSDYPFVAVLVPCYNEQHNIEETIDALMELQYPNFEVVAINDGSTDDTEKLLDALAAQHPRLRVIHHVKNQGKAVGLNTGALLTRADILVGIDGDARLDPWAIHWLVAHFEVASVGAVTGNPRMRNRSTLIGRIQVGEFSSMVGMIKRAQRALGAMFTISGAVSAFRRSALHEVGYWTHHRLTEDVDISWKLQVAGWDIRFEPRALCWILMPETYAGLWKQRLRWAMGGAQVMLSHAGQMLHWRCARLWPLYIEYYLSIIWAWLFSFALAFRVLDLVAIHVDLGSAAVLLPGSAGFLLGTSCLAQMLVGFLLDRPYDRDLLRNYLWAIWYPAVYWLIATASAVAGIPRVLLQDRQERARWQSPDRGVVP
ncbi:poly-beta-1,6-N-acetyl-D-glucosamine synthase [Dyella soli]|uniref:Poly-beta-1,6-N-acetyl-D-glucosamine synthase n=1 Tax=Dyella soli TaxID=522319 RepID=A0A4R0YTN0_9GAMM|nr:poly-beta-1,6-N-acetyl-D-glucosamine synthase [Dyella soli]TCI09620.1 poly-beta-1,6 N-acetyl-D-glucosamine synthase [Dyella soli]